MSWSLNKKVTSGFATVLAILAVAGFVSYRSTHQLIQIGSRVTHSRQVLEVLDEMLTTMDDAETGQRGYLLTRRESYLEPYQAAVIRLPKVFKKLVRLTANDPGQQHSIALLEGHVREKKDELATTISLEKANRPAAVSQLILSGRGKKDMDDVRVLIQQMKKTEENRMKTG